MRRVNYLHIAEEMLVDSREEVPSVSRLFGTWLNLPNPPFASTVSVWLKEGMQFAA